MYKYKVKEFISNLKPSIIISKRYIVKASSLSFIYYAY